MSNGRLCNDDDLVLGADYAYSDVTADDAVMLSDNFHIRWYVYKRRDAVSICEEKNIYTSAIRNLETNSQVYIS